MELRHLRYFRAVAEELHFGRAAVRLHMEPQPLNFQIKQLEREIGVTLFSHSGNRTNLTAAGSAFLADAEDILSAADRAVERAARVARGESGALRIGAISPFGHGLLAAAVKQLRVTLPEASFDLRTMPPYELERALNRHELDLGFTFLPVPDENFASVSLSRATPIVALPADDPAARARRVPWQYLDGRDAVVLEPRPTSCRQHIDNMLSEHGVHLKSSQHADSVEAALAFVSVGLGIFVLHPFVAPAAYPDVVFASLPQDAPELELGAIWRRNESHLLRDRFLAAITRSVSSPIMPALAAAV